MERRLPNYMKLRNVCSAGNNRKPLSSFIAANVERDQDGSFRLPSSFRDKFGEKLYYHLYLKCENLMWLAVYDQNRKKICGLNDFLRFYDLRMYSVLIFEYFGAGNFTVKCYKPTATSAVSPTIDPVEFFANENSKQLRMDEFIYGRNKLEIEKYIGLVWYNALKQDPEEFKMEIEGIAKRQERQILVLHKDLENLYKNWKGKDMIFLTTGMRMWKIEVLWDNEHCMFGNGWYSFLKDIDISTGDVIAMNRAESHDIVLICIFKKQELSFQKEAGEKDGRRSFYKLLHHTTIKHGHVVLPALIGVETEKSLSAVEKILIYENEWQIRYDQKLRIIYGLDKVIEHYNLMFLDSIHFSFGSDGEFCGRIFKRDGMEIMYSSPGSSSTIQNCKDFFLFEDSHKDPNLDMGDAKLFDVISQGEDRNTDVNMHDVIQNVVPDVMEAMVPDEIENVEADMTNDVEYDMIYQFSKRLITCNMNKRCHGMHIPKNMRFQNRDWKKGDTVTFRTARGSWNIRIVLNNGRARFSGGWSKFVKDQELKRNDNLRFTLREEGDNAIFDIEVNPRN